METYKLKKELIGDCVLFVFSSVFAVGYALSAYFSPSGSDIFWTCVFTFCVGVSVSWILSDLKHLWRHELELCLVPRSMVMDPNDINPEQSR